MYEFSEKAGRVAGDEGVVVCVLKSIDRPLAEVIYLLYVPLVQLLTVQQA